MSWFFQNIAYCNLANLALFWAFSRDVDVTPSRVVNQMVIPALMYVDLLLSRMVVRFTHILFPVGFLLLYCAAALLYPPFVKATSYPHFLALVDFKTVFAPLLVALVYGFVVIPLTQLFVIGVVHARVRLWQRLNKSTMKWATRHGSFEAELFLTLPGHLEPPRVVRRSKGSPAPPFMTPITSSGALALEADENV